jgi:hypothetical protein
MLQALAGGNPNPPILPPLVRTLVSPLFAIDSSTYAVAWCSARSSPKVPRDGFELLIRKWKYYKAALA